MFEKTKTKRGNYYDANCDHQHLVIIPTNIFLAITNMCIYACTCIYIYIHILYTCISIYQIESSAIVNKDTPAHCRFLFFQVIINKHLPTVSYRCYRFITGHPISKALKSSAGWAAPAEARGPSCTAPYLRGSEVSSAQ